MNKNNVLEKVLQFIKGLIPYVVIIILVLLFKKFIASPIRVNGDSMYPTLTDGDIMILDNLSYRLRKIERFDIVVVKVKKEYIIKRVIGLPGEKIDYINGQLYINDKANSDDAFDDITDDYSIVVPDGEYFILGDNRLNSLDSRFFGTFKDNEILGNSDFVVFPFSRFGVKK